MTQVSVFLDKLIDRFLPPAFTTIASLHWTPAHVSRRVSQFLAGEGNPVILDIGSGVGKFCLAAAHFTPTAYFVGVEQRGDLVRIADEAKRSLGLKNVTFIHDDFTRLDMSRFDHFYFYNSFYEHISNEQKIDDKIEYSLEQYNYYTSRLHDLLHERPAHTRLCTYSGWNDEVPSSFSEVEFERYNSLKYWIKN